RRWRAQRRNRPRDLGARARGRDAPRDRPRDRPGARPRAARRPAALGARPVARRARAGLASRGRPQGRPAPNLGLLPRVGLGFPRTGLGTHSVATEGHVRGTAPGRGGKDRLGAARRETAVGHYAPVHDLSSPWRTRTLIASGIAAVELLALIALAVVLLGK